MKRILFATICTLVLYPASKTSAQDIIAQEINEQVWLPFIQAYAEFDAQGFMSVHADDIIRVTRDSRGIRVGEEYAESMRANALRNRELGTVRSIALSFIERIHTDTHGFEVGYYKVLRAQGGQEQVFYGMFHVVLKKIDGKWKIVLDSDTSQGGSITEEDFVQGEVLTR